MSQADPTEVPASNTHEFDLLVQRVTELEAVVKNRDTPEGWNHEFIQLNAYHDDLQHRISAIQELIRQKPVPSEIELALERFKTELSEFHRSGALQEMRMLDRFNRLRDEMEKGLIDNNRENVSTAADVARKEAINVYAERALQDYSDVLRRIESLEASVRKLLIAIVILGFLLLCAALFTFAIPPES